jgi:hypothetical protein
MVQNDEGIINRALVRFATKARLKSAGKREDA